MVNRDSLKIEFRAIPYGDTGNHVLEYRISPDQNIDYVETKKFLFLKWKRKRKFSTKWIQPSKFCNYPGLYKRTEDEGYLPILIKDRKDLEFYKFNFKTIGEFFKYRDKCDNKEREEYKKERIKFLEEYNNWY